MAAGAAHHRTAAAGAERCAALHCAAARSAASLSCSGDPRRPAHVGFTTRARGQLAYRQAQVQSDRGRAGCSRLFAARGPRGWCGPHRRGPRRASDLPQHCRTAPSRHGAAGRHSAPRLALLALVPPSCCDSQRPCSPRPDAARGALPRSPGRRGRGAAETRERT